MKHLRFLVQNFPQSQIHNLVFFELLCLSGLYVISLKYENDLEKDDMDFSFAELRQNPKITRYVEILSMWNKKMNLVQENTLGDVFFRHVLDCAQVVKFLDYSDYIIDVGSGAGLPGIVLSIMGFQNVTLCEKSFKKCVFLEDVQSQLGLDCKVYNGDVFEMRVPFDVMSRSVLVSRAFGSLLDLLTILEKLNVSRGTFHKGRNYRNEVSEACSVFDFVVDVNSSVVAEDSVILCIRNVRRK